MMLQEELPLLHAAFLQHGLHAAHMMSMWHQQCFIGILGIPDAVCYIAMGLILGVDWMMYHMLAVLQQQDAHIKQKLLHEGTLEALLPCMAALDVQAAVPYMEYLQQRWSGLLMQFLVKQSLV